MVMKLDDAIKCRQCVRHYSNKPVNWGKLSLVLEAATHAPCAGGIFTVRLIIVANKEKIKQLADACQQPFVSQAQFVIVVCSETSQTEKAYGERAKMYIRQQAGAAIQSMFLKATDLGLATCWVGAFDDNLIKTALKIPIDVQVEALLPIANPLKPLPKRTKKEKLNLINLKRIVWFERYQKRWEKFGKQVEAL